MQNLKNKTYRMLPRITKPIFPKLGHISILSSVVQVPSSWRGEKPSFFTTTSRVSLADSNTSVSTALAPLKHTSLHAFHIAHSGKMVTFAGWSMPVHYEDGILASHFHTRKYASLFDVGHMLQTRWKGKDSTAFLESLVVADLKELAPGHSTLSVFTNENGGIIDDTVITKEKDNQFYIVTNAGCADSDIAHLNKHLDKFRSEKEGDVKYEILDRSLIAVQGPKAATIMEAVFKSSFSDFAFMTRRNYPWMKSNLSIARCGYTGEDGFEIEVPNEIAVDFTSHLLTFPELKLAGLGARDSLRLEAGLCLYGHDLNESISPVSAGLAWTIEIRRRVNGGFLGADIILPQLGKPGPPIRRVGLIVDGPPAREGATIFDAEGKRQIGHVTSGCPSPVLMKNISMGYVENGSQKPGTTVLVNVRDKLRNAQIVKMPFVPHNYYK